MDDFKEQQQVHRLGEQVEEVWLNRLADEVESEGTEGSISLEEMAALLRSDQA